MEAFLAEGNFVRVQLILLDVRQSVILNLPADRIWSIIWSSKQLNGKTWVTAKMDGGIRVWRTT